MKQKVFAMIPARLGSQRLKLKNLAILNGKPLIYYAVKEAKSSKVFKFIYAIFSSYSDNPLSNIEII